MTMNVPSGVKVKGLEIVPNVADGGDFEVMWGAHFNWSGWIKPQIDAAQNLGANCVKAGLPIQTLSAGGSGATTALTRLKQYLDYTVAQGLLVYAAWGLAVVGAPSGGMVSGISSLCTLLNNYSNVIGIDGCNEISGSGTSQANATAWMTPITAAVRGACTVPLTYSIYATDSSFMAGGAGTWIDLIAPFVDYQDFHPYFGGANSPSATQPAPGNWNPYRGADTSSNYRPWFIGENGAPLGAGGTAQTNRWTALGVLAKEFDCYGVIGFSMVDYDTSSPNQQFGVYDSTLSNPRSAITTPFAAWPTTSVLPTDYPTTIFCDGAVGFWELAEPSGTTAIDSSSGGAATGTYQNASTGVTLAQTGIAGGGGRTAARFVRANSGYMSVPNTSGQLNVGDVFSLEIWVKLASVGIAQNVFGTDNVGGQAIIMSSSNHVECDAQNTAAIVTSTNTIAADGNFHHIVWTRRGATNKIYVDAVDVSGTVTNHAISANFGMQVGAGGSGGGTNKLDGTAQFAAIYAFPLTPTQVAAHYARGLASAPTNSVAPVIS